MKRWLWIPILLLVLALTAVTAVLLPSSPANYALSLEAEATTVAVGEEVVLTATLQNEAFTYDYPVFNALFIDIRREDEEPPIILSFARTMPFFPFQKRSVTETYTFSEPGTYVMKAYCPMSMGIREISYELEATLVITVTG